MGRTEIIAFTGRFGCGNARTVTGRKQELVEEVSAGGVRHWRSEGEEEWSKMIGDTTCVYSGVQGGRANVGVTISLSERLVDI